MYVYPHRNPLHSCMCTLMYVCCTHVCVYTQKPTCAYIHKHMCVSGSPRSHIWVCVCTCVCLCREACDFTTGASLCVCVSVFFCRPGSYAFVCVRVCFCVCVCARSSSGSHDGVPHCVCLYLYFFAARDLTFLCVCLRVRVRGSPRSHDGTPHCHRR